MSPLDHPRRVLAGVVAAVAITGLGGVAVAAAPQTRHTAPAATQTSGTVATPHSAAALAAASSGGTEIDRLTTAAVQQYAAEVSGPKAKHLASGVAHDPTLLRLLESNNLKATRAYVAREFAGVWYHWHVSGLRILQGSRVVDEVGVPFTVAGPSTTLRGTDGRSLGTLQISIQDEIGFVRLMHRLHPIDVVVRGAAGQVRSSLAAAEHVALPSRGSVMIAGRHYEVRSFHEKAWANEPVTVWILMHG